MVRAPEETHAPSNTTRLRKERVKASDPKLPRDKEKAKRGKIKPKTKIPQDHSHRTLGNIEEEDPQQDLPRIALHPPRGHPDVEPRLVVTPQGDEHHRLTEDPHEVTPRAASRIATLVFSTPAASAPADSNANFGILPNADFTG